MIDHLVGRPRPSWKRVQVFLVILFWLWRIARGSSGPPGFFWLPRLNRALKRFTPWQIVLSTLTAVYTLRNFDMILGLSAPEPLAQLYSSSYYRATWIVTGLDAGFATAMSIRPKWLRDTASIVFSVYYIIYAQEADEKLRRFRAVPTVEMLRTTWEKTTHPIIRFITHLPLPLLGVRRKILLPRPKSSSYTRPIAAYLYFARPESELCKATDLILDCPGGGYVAMTPEHHEERLRKWAITTGRPVLSLDYGKAPEYPYPFAIDEAFDAYRLMTETSGKLIGMSGKKIRIIISGDSAGGTLAVNIVIKILELRNIAHATHQPINLPLPTAVVLNYPALDLNFTSWMSAENLRVLRSEQSSGNLPGLKELAEQKDHLRHVSPLSMVKDKRTSKRRMKRRSSWKDTLKAFASGTEENTKQRSRQSSLSKDMPVALGVPDEGTLADAESEDEDLDEVKEEDRPIEARVRYKYHEGSSEMMRSTSVLEKKQYELSMAVAEADSKAIKAVTRKSSAEAIGTRLTMTSRTGYFQDRIISPSMMRAMAILYIGPHRNPDFATDYHISPILAPSHLLAQFPPLLMQCGEKDPFVDDTVIFAGRVREAKRARKVELDLALSGKSALFGDSLRMSSLDNHLDGRSTAEMSKEREKLGKEDECDWVQMVLFSDWSHGYLQMPTILSEARTVIEELGEWIEHAFERYGTRMPEEKMPGSGVDSEQPSPIASEAETDDTGITFIPRRAEKAESRSSSSEGTLVETQKARAGKQVISESELMRRRRLLDSHIFE